jgi:hypothetical protein
MSLSRKIRLFTALAGVAALAGCREPQARPAAREPLCLPEASVAEVVAAAGETLGRMHFEIEKLDAERGFVRTRPLRGAQFFELWRSDNVNAASAAEANLHTIRRVAELHVARDDGRTCVECEVAVQRLSLPENEVASTSQAYMMHSRSSPSMQRLELGPEQRRGLAWIDLGNDDLLAAEILGRLARIVNNPKP